MICSWIGPYIEHFYYVRDRRRKTWFCVHLFPSEYCQPKQPIPPSPKGSDRFIFNPNDFSPLTTMQEKLFPSSNNMNLIPSPSNISLPAHVSLTSPSSQDTKPPSTTHKTSSSTERGGPNQYMYLMETNEQVQAWQQAIRVRIRWQMVKDLAQLTPIQFPEGSARAPQSVRVVMSELQMQKAGAVSSPLAILLPQMKHICSASSPCSVPGVGCNRAFGKTLFPHRENNWVK